MRFRFILLVWEGACVSVCICMFVSIFSTFGIASYLLTKQKILIFGKVLQLYKFIINKQHILNILIDITQHMQH